MGLMNGATAVLVWKNPGIFPEPRPRLPYGWNGAEPLETNRTCASKPPCASVPKRRMTPPSRRLKPMPPPVPPPPPDSPSASTLFTAGGGTVGSKIDQPWVWQRAQFSSNRICPSVTLARRFFHSPDHVTTCCALETLFLPVR